MRLFKLVNILKVITSVFASAVMMVGATTTDNDAEVDSFLLDELKEKVESVRLEYNIPAIGIAIHQDGLPAITQGFGYTNKVTKTSVTDMHIFRFGSVTKLLPGIAILQLQEQGLLALDDNLHDLAPNIQFENKWQQTHPIQIQHLLEHTTGWDNHPAEQKVLADDTMSLQQVVAIYPQSRVSRWAPGTRQAYSNTGPTVAARVVEIVTGMRFSDYVDKHIFAPLGMTSSDLRKPKNWGTMAATPYLNDGTAVGYEHMATRPASSLSASMQDMAKLLKLFLEPELSNVLSQSSVSRMQRIETELAFDLGLESFNGFAHSKDIVNGEVFYGHNGGLPGVVSTFRYQPERKVGFVIAMTAQNASAYQKVKKLLADYLSVNKPVAHIEAVPLSDKFTSAGGIYTQLNTSMALGNVVGYFANAMVVDAKGKQLTFKFLLNGYQLNYVQKNEQPVLYNKNGYAHVAFAEDPVAGEVLVRHSKVYRKTPTWWFYTKLVTLVVTLTLILSSVLYIIFMNVNRMIKKLLGKPVAVLNRGQKLTVMATVTLVCAMLPILLLSQYALLNHLLWISPLLFMCSVVYPVITAMAMGLSIHQWKKGTQGFSAYYLASIVLAHGTLALFLINYQIFAIQLSV